MPLSDIKIRNLKSGDKVYKVSDFEGLFIPDNVSGAKTWRFKYGGRGIERSLVTVLMRAWRRREMLHRARGHAFLQA